MLLYDLMEMVWSIHYATVVHENNKLINELQQNMESAKKKVSGCSWGLIKRNENRINILAGKKMAKEFRGDRVEKKEHYTCEI